MASLLILRIELIIMMINWSVCAYVSMCVSNL